MHHVCLRAMSHPGAFGEPLRSQKFLHSGHKSHGDFISWGYCFWCLPILLLATESMACLPQELRKHKLCSTPLGSNTSLGFAETYEQALPVSYQLPGLHSLNCLHLLAKTPLIFAARATPPRAHQTATPLASSLCPEPRSCRDQEGAGRELAVLLEGPLLGSTPASRSPWRPQIRSQPQTQPPRGVSCPCPLGSEHRGSSMPRLQGESRFHMLQVVSCSVLQGMGPNQPLVRAKNAGLC